MVLASARDRTTPSFPNLVSMHMVGRISEHSDGTCNGSNITSWGSVGYGVLMKIVSHFYHGYDQSSFVWIVTAPC